MKRILSILAALAVVFNFNYAFAQNDGKLRSMVSPWIYSLQGHYITWILQVVDVNGNTLNATLIPTTQSEPGTYIIPISAGETGGKTTLSFTTRNGNTIVLTEASEGNFSGTWTSPNGETKWVGIRKISPDAIPSERAQQRKIVAERMLKQPGPDVPPACAALHGHWQGRWTIGGIGVRYLTVSEVAADCTAKVAYGSDGSVPVSGYMNQRISDDGTLEFVCNSSTGGTCRFKLRGSDLWANYSNTGGGNNSAVFEKVLN